MMTAERWSTHFVNKLNNSASETNNVLGVQAFQSQSSCTPKPLLFFKVLLDESSPSTFRGAWDILISMLFLPSAIEKKNCP